MAWNGSSNQFTLTNAGLVFVNASEACGITYNGTTNILSFGDTTLETSGNLLVNGGFIGDTDDNELIEIDGAGGVVTIDGIALVDSGTALAPGFAFKGDTNTGIYLIGPDQIGIVAGSSLGLVQTPTAILPKLPVVINKQSTTLFGILGFERYVNGNSPAGTLDDNDIQGQIEFSGWDGSGYRPGCYITALSDGDAASGSMPTKLNIYTTPTGSIVPVLRTTICQDGTMEHAGDFLATGDVSGATLTAGDGATGSFTTVDAKTVTVTNGIITNIV
jgi:hypothetical protein